MKWMLELSEVVIVELIQDSLGHFQNLEASVVNWLDTAMDDEASDDDQRIHEVPHYGEQQQLPLSQSDDDVKYDENDSIAVTGQMNRLEYC